MPRLRPAREAIAAVILAPLLVAAATFAWMRRDAPAAECCDADHPVRLTAPIPEDSLLRGGRLPNALRYYVRANGWPEGRAELRLVINAGSVLEADDQRGLDRIKSEFRRVLLSAKPDAKLPF